MTECKFKGSRTGGIIARGEAAGKNAYWLSRFPVRKVGAEAFAFPERAVSGKGRMNAGSTPMAMDGGEDAGESAREGAEQVTPAGLKPIMSDPQGIAHAALNRLNSLGQIGAMMVTARPKPPTDSAIGEDRRRGSRGIGE